MGWSAKYYTFNDFQRTNRMLNPRPDAKGKILTKETRSGGHSKRHWHDCKPTSTKPKGTPRWRLDGRIFFHRCLDGWNFIHRIFLAGVFSREWGSLNLKYIGKFGMKLPSFRPESGQRGDFVTKLSGCPVAIWNSGFQGGKWSMAVSGSPKRW